MIDPFLKTSKFRKLTKAFKSTKKNFPPSKMATLTEVIALEILEAECGKSTEWDLLMERTEYRWNQRTIRDATPWHRKTLLRNMGLFSDPSYEQLWEKRGILMKEIIASLEEFVKYRKNRTSHFTLEQIRENQRIAEEEWKRLNDPHEYMDFPSPKNKGKGEEYTSLKDSYHFKDGREWSKESNAQFRSKDGAKRIYYPLLSAFRISDHKWYKKNYYWTCCGAPTKHHPPLHVDE
jgi:hypothetical protein